MAESAYLLLAIALVVSYLLLTRGGGSRTVRPRTKELARVVQSREREMDDTFAHYQQQIREGTRRK